MVSETCGGWKVFRRLSYGFGDFRVFIEVEVGGEGSHGLHYQLGHAWAPKRALVLSGPHGPPPVCSFGSLGVFWAEKNLQNVSWHFDFVWY